MTHLVYEVVLLLLMIGNRFLKTGSSSSLFFTIGEPTIGVVAIFTGESTMGSATTFYAVFS
jgi:hypothetical protein